MKHLAYISALLLTAFTATAQSFEIDLTKEQKAYDGSQGYDLGTTALPTKGGKAQMSYSVCVPDGNYRVSVTFGSTKHAGNTTLHCESRRLLAAEVTTKKNETKTVSWTLHKRSPKIYDNTGAQKDSVRYKAREKDYLNWDDKLTLTFNGANPAVSHIKIERDTTAQTIFLCGNSTVVDQEFEPWASWGQMITEYFDENVCIANYAESGERTTSFMASKRLDKALSMAREGDLFIVEFGHNDEKDRSAGSGAWYNFTTNLKTFVDRIRAAKCDIVLATPTARRMWQEGELKDTHGDYPTATRTVANREKCGLIDLTEMTTTLFKAMGEEDSKRLLVHYPANTFPDQDKPLADNTHFNRFGAQQVSKCIIVGLLKLSNSATNHLRNWTDYDPSKPDDYTKFTVPAVEKYEVAKPDGN